MAKGKTMLVATDVDNVLSDIIHSARQALANDLGISFHEVELTNVYSDPFTHRDPNVARHLRVSHAFWDRADVIDGCPAIAGSVEAISRLHQAGIFAGYVTRRPPSVKGGTRDWILSHGYPDMPVHHVGTTDFNTTFAVCKSTICYQMGATHLIDDHATEIATAAASGIEVIVVDAPIGHAARQKVLASHPHVRVARDASDAADILLADLMQRAA